MGFFRKMKSGWSENKGVGHSEGRRNRTISKTTYKTDSGKKADLRIDVGEPERHGRQKHMNIQTSTSISDRGTGSRTVMDNKHVPYETKASKKKTKK